MRLEDQRKRGVPLGDGEMTVVGFARFMLNAKVRAEWRPMNKEM